MTTKKSRIITVITVVLMAVCAIATFLYLRATAFCTLGMAQVVVPFCALLEMTSTKASIVGLFYLLSLTLSVLIIFVSIIILFGSKLLTKKPIETAVKTLLIGLCVFYSLHFAINIAVVFNRGGVSTAFYTYTFTELFKLASIALLLRIFWVQTRTIKSPIQ